MLIGVITAPRDMPAMLVLEHCDNGSLLDYIRTNVLETATSTKLTFCAEVAQGLEYISSLRVVKQRLILFALETAIAYLTHQSKKHGFDPYPH